MGHKRCFICYQQCFVDRNIENQLNTETSDGNVDKQLQVVFLLRKLLEISEDTCCKLLKHFGNPDLWIECCDSCSVLVRKCQSIFHQIASLEKHYDELRMSIKSTILKSQNHINFENQCETIVKSEIVLKDVDYFIKTASLEKDKETFPFVNSKDMYYMTCGSTSSQEESYPQSEDQNTFLKDVDPLTCESEQLISLQDTGENTICYNVMPPDLDDNINELQNDEELMDSESSYGHHYISDSETNVKPMNLLREEVVTPEELSNPQSENTETHTSRKIQKKQAKCVICGKWYSSSTVLQRHLRAHCKVSPFKCLKCGQAFETNDALQRHTASANCDNRPFQCDLCGQTFRRKDNLKYHQAVHTSDMQYPYTCVMCGMAFTEQPPLKVHYRLHTECKNKFFKCLICGEAFGSLNGLKAHNKLHLDGTV